ncbi:MAG: FtsH protease activity modulator HflK [Gammaproteobacteria bacterium]|nr:MAG: FtsH protease activity modulator HflK [Gammaproteobacteria bacterium]RKZ44109.1 MAG: FtsH protease activity modulator HflK [Gammaproteobacteria bacterium]RKZ77424.1 MAG: FtsH protease activity modulator HflK [Gammaproteobacteria bacterium]
MAWNEPGSSGNQDPWGNRKKEQGGPPDIDELVQKMGDKLGKIFGGNASNDKRGGGDNRGGSDSSNNNGNEGISWSGISLIIILLLAIWFAFGFYIIQPAELGVVTRFGEYNSTTEQGLNWHLPSPIEQVQKVNVEHVRSLTHRALMLTQDENIVVIELEVQYLVKDAKNYLFKVLDPDNTLHQATESALREVVGTSNMDGVLTSERTRVALETKVLIQDIVDRYQTGLMVTSVNMQNAQPPDAVQAAFADVIKAREDEERSKNQADAYSNQIVERAKGTSDRLRLEALAYKAQVTARSEGETKRFLSVLKEYEKAPAITRQRLYLESIETVLSNTSKVMVDIQGGNNLMVLPLDRLLGQTTNLEQTAPNQSPSALQSASRLRSADRGDDLRTRGGR